MTRKLQISDNEDGSYQATWLDAEGKPAGDGMKFTKKVYMQAWLEHEKQTGEPFSVRNAPKEG